MDFIAIWSAILIIGIFSLLIKENKLYKIVESIGVGGGVAHLLVMSLQAAYASGVVPATQGNYILIIPLVLGVLALLRLTPYKWVARYSYSILVGIGVGLVVSSTIQAQIINNLLVAGKIILDAKDSFTFVSGIIAAFGLITGLTYFFYTREQKGVLGGVSRIGRVFLMISFGSAWSTEVSWFMGTFAGQIEKVLRALLSIFGITF
jgi:hypothetical protein